MMTKNCRGGKRAGAGRKKGSTTRNTGYKTGRVVISCLPEEAEIIKRKAAQAGKTTSQFIIDLIVGQLD